MADRMLQGAPETSNANNRRTAEQEVNLYLAESSSAPSSLAYWQVSEGTYD